MDLTPKLFPYGVMDRDEHSHVEQTEEEEEEEQEEEQEEQVEEEAYEDANEMG